MRVRTNYVNPLAMMDKKQGGQETAFRAGKRNASAEELQNKRQQLQNQMLLLKASGTDSASGSEELQKELETALEKVAADLQFAKAEAVRAPHTAEDCAAIKHSPDYDCYESGGSEPESFGCYYPKKDEEMGWRMIFEPYQEK